MPRRSAPLRRLGAELRRLREATGRTQADVGEAVGRGSTTVVNWEAGKTRMSKGDLAYLLAELRAPIQVRKDLEQLWQEARQSGGQWAVYGLPGWLQPLLSFEDDAVLVQCFQPVAIPGMLQTAPYARACHIAAQHAVPKSDVDSRVAARMQRQERLRGSDPLRFHAVITESALRLQVGNPTDMAEQLQRLLEVVALDNVTVRVLPSTAGAQIVGASNFYVLHFADRATDPPLGYHDGPLGGYLVDDEGDVASLETLFTDLSRASLPEEESASLIGGILDELTNKGRNRHG